MPTTPVVEEVKKKEVKQVKDPEEWALRDTVATTSSSEVSVKVTYLRKLFKDIDDEREKEGVVLYDTQYELDQSNLPPESAPTTTTTPATPLV